MIETKDSLLRSVDTDRTATPGGRRGIGGAPHARFAPLAKPDRFVAQARRRATCCGGQFAGVAVEIDAAGAVIVCA